MGFSGFFLMCLTAQKPEAGVLMSRSRELIRLQFCAGLFAPGCVFFVCCRGSVPLWSGPPPTPPHHTHTHCLSLLSPACSSLLITPPTASLSLGLECVSPLFSPSAATGLIFTRTHWPHTHRHTHTHTHTHTRSITQLLSITILGVDGTEEAASSSISLLLLSLPPSPSCSCCCSSSSSSVV